MLAHKPSSDQESADQATGKDSPSLKCGQAENLARMFGVGMPVHEDVQNLRAEDSSKHDSDAEIPSFFGLNALLLRIADTDPEADEDAQSDQDAVGWNSKAAEMKKTGKHYL